MAKTLSGGRGWLADAAADSIHRMDGAYGGRIPINSAGRTNAEQWEAWRKYKNGGPLAAYPGTSVHETGNAVDFHYSSWAWLGSGKGLGWNGARANGFGWRRTVSSESWHYEYDVNRDLALAQAALGIAVDGIDGPQTQQAIRNFQARNGLTVDGKIGPQTIGKIRAGGAASGGGSSAWPARALYGEAWVRSIQEKLNKVGYRVGVDGKDGPETQNAVRDFQKKHGLGVDGVAGPATNNKLDAVIAGNGGKITVDGDWGPATTSALQKVLGVAVDGQLGPQTIKALQTRLKVTADGQIGPQTIRALQAVVGAVVDGEIGPNTVKALQNYLNAGGNFNAKAPTPANPPAEKLVVDGDWGPATTRALQKKLGVSVDGEIGPETAKALQNALGVTADGQIGPQTIRALQTFLGVSVDGQIGPQTTKALQTFLNEGGDFKKVEVPAEPEVVKYPKPAKPTYPGATWWDHSSNSSPRDDKVQYFVIHHAAFTGALNNLRDLFMRPNDRNVSPNWLIGKDGSVSEIVPPDHFRAWTSGSFDHKAVTVETQNTSGDPNWGISEESRVSIAHLVAWASKRYGFPIDNKHVIGHKQVPGAATACPGPSMDVPRIIELAKQFAAEAEEPVDPTEPIEQPEEPTPEVPEEPETPTPGTPSVTLTFSKADAEELVRIFKLLTEMLEDEL